MHIQMRRLLMLVLGVIVLSAQLLAQNRTVTGTVTDDKGNPLPNASVTVKGSSQGTVTDEKGTFTLVLPANGNSLIVSSVGYGQQEIAINNRSAVSITLGAADQSLNEVVVVAYG